MSDGPHRTCLGCRQRKLKRELVRLVRRPDGAVALDATGAAPGRGAYVCADAGCAERALKAGRLSHAFRAPSQPVAALEAAVRQAGADAERVVSGSER
jgi:predicted RNA-binding protein YlxR (DUF448 family)